MGNILWLASYPKSGNTWIRAFLANLVANRPTPLPLSELPRYCSDDALPELYARLAGRPVTELDIGELCALRTRVHAAMVENRRGTLFVKTHNLAGSFDGHPLQNMALTSGAIYVVRNPLDVAVSMTYHFGLTVDEAIDRLAADGLATATDDLFVGQVLGSWSRHVSSWSDIANERIVVIRYEDLLEKPVKAFGKIAKLVGLGDNRQDIDRAIRYSNFQTLASIEKRDGFVEVSDKTRRFFRIGRANQWRTALTREQISRIIHDHREQMMRFKYVPAGY